jgi:hypothetical protein
MLAAQSALAPVFHLYFHAAPRPCIFFDHTGS